MNLGNTSDPLLERRTFSLSRVEVLKSFHRKWGIFYRFRFSAASDSRSHSTRGGEESRHNRRYRRMRCPDLPHRRYSMPETVMRKFRLGQSSSSSSSESLNRGRPRRQPTRRKSKGNHTTNRASQTSPQVKCQSDPKCLNGHVLLQSSPSLPRQRANSFPDLSSDEGKIFKLRPSSASDKFFGTPSPSNVSCYGPPSHRCGLCSNTWSYTSSDYTLSQTVSDRTTSTQDSTLSVQSSSPSANTPISFNSEKARVLQNSIYAPANNFIAVHTECLLIKPIQINESAENWRFGFDQDDQESKRLPQSVGTITEDDIAAITSGRKDRSTSIMQSPEVTKEIGINTLNVTNVGTQVQEEKSIGCQTTNAPNKLFDKQGRNDKSFQTDRRKPCCSQIACSGGNYKDIVLGNHYISRPSAYPRSNSMIVNTSSIDYTSDSDLSLTDSLEEIPCNMVVRENRHDNRLVRGEVSLDRSIKKRYPRRQDAYAYFLSMNGEQDMIRENAIPDWLTARLKRREEEIKKLFEVKLKNQTIIYRKRKKTIRRIANYNESSSNSKDKKKSMKSVKFENNDEIPSKSEKPQTGENSKASLKNSQERKSPENGSAVSKNNQENNNYVHISEIIKIEMSNQLKTVITKEKQIHLNKEAFLNNGKNIQTSEFINNEDEHNSQKIVMKTNVGQFQMDAGTMVDMETKNDDKFTQPPKKSSYSFKQFRPLFESKADDRTVAQILMSAMEECENDARTESKNLSTQSSADQVGIEKESKQVSALADFVADKVVQAGNATETKKVSTADSPFTADRIVQAGNEKETKNVSTRDSPFTTDEIVQAGNGKETKKVSTADSPFTADRIVQTGNGKETKKVSTEDTPFTADKVFQVGNGKESKKISTSDSPFIKDEIIQAGNGRESKKVSTADSPFTADGIVQVEIGKDTKKVSTADSPFTVDKVFQVGNGKATKTVSTADSPFTADEMVQAGNSVESKKVSTLDSPFTADKMFQIGNGKETKKVSTLDSPFTADEMVQAGNGKESKKVSTSDSPFTADKVLQIGNGKESKKVSTSDAPFTVDEEQKSKSVSTSAPFTADEILQVGKTKESRGVSTSSPFTADQIQQTDDETRREEKSCNTTQPYLSEVIQTTESYLETIQSPDSDSPSPLSEIFRMEDKGTCVSTLVQTKESFYEDEISFIEMLNNREEKSTEIEEKTSEKSCNTMNPSVESSMQTETVEKPIMEKKTGARTTKKDVHFRKGVEKSSRNKKETPTLYCKRTGQPLSDDPNTPQILELNNPPCSCHICLLHKKQSEKKEKPKVEKKEEKKPIQRVGTRNRNGNKFLRKFEAIPEEKNSSTESVTEELIPLDLAKDLKSFNKSTMTQNRPREAFVENENEIVERVTKVQVNKKSNVVFGRFRAVPDEENKRDQQLLGEGLEIVRQYKGRAALATTQVEGHDELMTLSKGWINFYLLNDNQDVSDNDDAQIWQNESIPGHATPKFSNNSKIAEEKYKQYTVEIHATPEPIQPKSVILPDLPLKESRKRHSRSGKNQGTTTLPEINSSSSSSTPENTEKHHRKYHQLPEVNGRTKSSRREYNSLKEHVIEKLSKTGVETEVDFGGENTLATKAVEVARSEHSVSSITSSTVILSESPSPQQLQLSERKTHRRQTFYSTPANDIGTSWTVTVAGSSGMKNQTPPDVEMKLSFSKTNNTRSSQENGNHERSVTQYNTHQTAHISRSKRQGKMIEQYAHSLRNERHSLQYVPDVTFQNLQQTKRERNRVQDHKDEIFFDLECPSRFDTRSKMSMDGSDGSVCSDLQVTGLAITPELKPRVPTQSERDLVRRQRYRFTR